MATSDSLRRRTVLRSSVSVAGAASMFGLAGCLSDISSGGTDAEEYPTNDVEIIVPFATGGGFDAYSRLSEPYWEEKLDGTVVVTNVEGGGGITGTTQLYNSDPDGHTFGIYDSYQGITQQIGKDVEFDIREMEYIGSITNTPGAFVVMESANITGWDDFITRIEEFNFATQGSGSYGHTILPILSLYIDEIDQDDFNFVHFDGTGEVMAGLERGEADVFYISTITSGVKTVKSLENASIFTVFDNEENIGWYLDEEGVDTDYYSSEVGINNAEEFNEMSYDRRFFLEPPDVPDDILEIQRNAFNEFIEDEAFVEEMAENGRPIIDPGGPEKIEGYIDNIHDIMSQDEYREILETAMN